MEGPTQGRFHAIEIGQVRGDYEILEKLGEGGMGAVYKVRNKLYNRVEAMKVLRAEQLIGLESEERFLREIKVLASLDHPKIACLYTAQRIDGAVCMLMEYVEGESLDKAIEKGDETLTIADIVGYAIQVLDALAYAHSCTVVHRDIKPSNIMRTVSGDIKLLDFGIARMQEDRKITRTGCTPGSPHYASPEQIKGEVLDCRSDIYSLGVSLYEMVAGRLPFEGSLGTLLNGHLNEEPISPIEIEQDLPESLNRCILTAIDKDPNKRYQTAEAFRVDLKSVYSIAEDIVVVEPKVSRRWLYMTCGGAAVLAVLLIAAIEGPRLFRDGIVRAVPQPSMTRAYSSVPNPSSSSHVPPVPGGANVLSTPTSSAAPRQSHRKLPVQTLAQQRTTQPLPERLREKGPSAERQQAGTTPSDSTTRLTVPVELHDRFVRLSAAAAAFKTTLDAARMAMRGEAVSLHPGLERALSVAQAKLSEAEKETAAGAYANAQKSLDAAERELLIISERLGLKL